MRMSVYEIISSIVRSAVNRTLSDLIGIVVVVFLSGFKRLRSFH